MKTKINYTCDAPVPDTATGEGLVRCNSPARYLVGRFEEPVCEKCKKYLEKLDKFKEQKFVRIGSSDKQRNLKR